MTLTNTTLQLMTWTKLKTTAVAATVFVLAAGTATLTVQQLRRSRPDTRLIEGSWEGSLQVQDASLRLVFHLARSADGSYVAKLDSVDQGVAGIAAKTVLFTNGVLYTQLPTLFANYRGELNEDGTTFQGTWQQGPASFPLELIRTTQPARVAEPLSAATYRPSPDSALQGYWKGTLLVGGTTLRLAMKIAETESGTFSGSFKSIDQGAKELPISAIRYQKPNVQMDFLGIGGFYDGDLNPEGSEITGRWTQQGREFPLVLQRADPAEDELKFAPNAYMPRGGDDVKGYWLGTLTANGTDFRLLLRIAEVADRKLVAWLDSLDQGSTDLLASGIHHTNSDLRVEWKALAISYDARLERDRLVGTWKQGPLSFPLALLRTNQSAPPALR